MNSKKKLVLVIGFVLVMAVIALLYFVLMMVDGKTGSVKRLKPKDEEEYYIEKDPIMLGEQEYELAHDISTYLLMGTDKSGAEEQDEETYHGSMADFLLVVMVDDTNKSYGYIQLNRDTMAEVPVVEKDSGDVSSAVIQLCCAHWYGNNKKESCRNTVTAVSNLLCGIPIDGYYALKMEALPELNHAVGGVTVTIEDDFTSFDPEMQAGKTMKLTDEQAFIFVQTRKGITDDDNAARMKRHRTFMDAFVKSVEGRTEDQKFIIQVYNDLSEYSTTDMGSKTVSELAEKLASYTSKGMVTPEGRSTIGQALGDGIDHQEFYVDKDKLEKLIMDMYPLKAVEDTEVEE